jgi:hypothetical protein
MNALRVVFTLLVSGLAAFLFFKGLKSDVEPPEPPPGTPSTTDGKGWFPPVAGQEKAPTGKPAPKQVRPAPPKPRVEPPRGTPVAPDAVVSVDVTYKAGTKSRYLVHEALLMRDQEPPHETHWGEWVWTIATEVVRAEADDVRVKLQLDEFEFHTDGAAGRVEFKSSSPDPLLLQAEGFDVQLRPWMEVRGIPVEVVLAPGGSVREIRGVQTMTTKFLDALEAVSAKAVENAVWTPNVESLRQRWTDLLFPGFGGGTMKAGETREAAFAFTQHERWAVLSSGRFRATHDDPDVFRVEFKGTPKIQELPREAHTPAGKSVAKVHVQSSADVYVASWRVDRKAGRLVSAELEAKYTQATAVHGTPDERGQLPRIWFDVERLSSVELLAK